MKKQLVALLLILACLPVVLCSCKAGRDTGIVAGNAGNNTAGESSVTQPENPSSRIISSGYPDSDYDERGLRFDNTQKMQAKLPSVYDKSVKVEMASEYDIYTDKQQHKYYFKKGTDILIGRMLNYIVPPSARQPMDEKTADRKIREFMAERIPDFDEYLIQVTPYYEEKYDKDTGEYRGHWVFYYYRPLCGQISGDRLRIQICDAGEVRIYWFYQYQEYLNAKVDQSALDAALQKEKDLMESCGIFRDSEGLVLVVTRKPTDSSKEYEKEEVAYLIGK